MWSSGSTSNAYWNEEDVPAPEGVDILPNHRYRFQLAKLGRKNVVANIVKALPNETQETH